MWSTEHRDFYVFIPAAQPEQKCRYVIDIPLFWIGPKEGQADVIYCSLSIYFLRDRDKLIQMSTITLFVFFFFLLTFDTLFFSIVQGRHDWSFYL